MFQRTPQESVETIPKFLLLRQMSARNGDQVKSSSMFQLPSSSKFEMGYKLGWNYRGDIGDSDCKDKSESNACNGLVQFKAQKSLESGGEKKDSMEVYSPNLTNPRVLQQKSMGDVVVEKDVRDSADINIGHGK